MFRFVCVVCLLCLISKMEFDQQSCVLIVCELILVETVNLRNAEGFWQIVLGVGVLSSWDTAKSCTQNMA